MGRKPIIRTNEYYYHVTNRTNNKDWFSIPIETVWAIFLSKLSLARLKWNLEIISFVLMQNHYHLLLRTPDCNIDKAMHCLNHRLAIEIGKNAKRINRIFGGRYKGSLIKNKYHFYLVYRYIYQNPLRAGICRDIKNYRFSSFALSVSTSNSVSSSARKHNFSELEDKYALAMKDNEKFMNWINNFDDRNGENDQIQKGLSKREFKPVYKRKN